MLYYGNNKIATPFFNVPLKEVYNGSVLVWKKQYPIILPKPIDLGLDSGIDWYPMNIDANLPYDDGKLYALNDYLQELSYPPPLEGTYWDFVDPAVNILIPGRRTPSSSEWRELFECEKELIYNDDVNMYICRIIGHNGNSLILPLGEYITNSISHDIVSSEVFYVKKVYGQNTLDYGTKLTYIGNTDGADDSKIYMLRAVKDH